MDLMKLLTNVAKRVTGFIINAQTLFCMCILYDELIKIRKLEKKMLLNIMAMSILTKV